ncbi:MAG: hypothetical protein WEB52_06735 [Dehalococcoidia bacterium]
MRIPFFGKKDRAPKPLAPPSMALPSGEEVKQATKATLLYGKQVKKGVLHMTNRRLLFEAEKGDAKWMSVPYADVTSTGLYPWPGATMGMPSSRQQCLVVETAQGEQVWWDFGEKDEKDWLPLVQQYVTSAKPEPSEHDE